MIEEKECALGNEEFQRYGKARKNEKEILVRLDMQHMVNVVIVEAQMKIKKKLNK